MSHRSRRLHLLVVFELERSFTLAIAVNKKTLTGLFKRPLRRRVSSYDRESNIHLTMMSDRRKMIVD